MQDRSAEGERTTAAATFDAIAELARHPIAENRVRDEDQNEKQQRQHYRSGVCPRTTRPIPFIAA